jgi:hypothetical protein
MLAGPGWLAVQSTRGRHWLAPAHFERWRRLADTQTWDGDLAVYLCPWLDRGSFLHPARSGVVWAHLESGDSCARLSRFRVRPTLVVSEGGSVRRTAVWALTRPLSHDWCERANRRLAHFFRGPKKHCGTTGRLYIPGTVLRAGRKRPVPASVEEFNPDAIYTARQVVGALKDAPDPDAWRQAS